MALAKLSLAQAALLVHLRNYSGSDQTRKDMKADLFKLVKDSFGIPHEHKLSVEIDNASSPDFLVLKRKKNGMPYDLGADGRWVDAPGSQPAAQVAPATHTYTVSFSKTVIATDADRAARDFVDEHLGFTDDVVLSVTDDTGLTTSIDMEALDF